MSGAIHSLIQYTFMALYLVKHRDNFTFTFTFTSFTESDVTLSIPGYSFYRSVCMLILLAEPLVSFLFQFLDWTTPL